MHCNTRKNDVADFSFFAILCLTLDFWKHKVLSQHPLGHNTDNSKLIIIHCCQHGLCSFKHRSSRICSSFTFSLFFRHMSIPR